MSLGPSDVGVMSTLHAVYVVSGLRRRGFSHLVLSQCSTRGVMVVMAVMAGHGSHQAPQGSSVLSTWLRGTPNP